MVLHVTGCSDPAKVLATPGVPPPNEERDYNGIKVSLKRYGVPSLVSPTICRVECFYDNDGSSRGPQLPDEHDPQYKSIEIRWVKDVERVPAWQLFHDIIDIDPDRDTPGNAPGPFARAERWEPTEFTWSSRSASAEVTVTIANMDAGVQRAIADQVNNIHLFPDGLLWQFVGGDTRRIEENKWTITYSWIHDPGQKVGAPHAILGPTVDETDEFYYDRNAGPNVLGAGSLLIPYFPRPSFAQYHPIPSQVPFEDDNSNPLLYRPDIKLIPARAFRVIEENGWRDLPGNPIG